MINKSIKARVKVIVLTEEGGIAIREIKGLKEGDIVEGYLHDGIFNFKWGGQDAVLFVGENCSVLDTWEGKKIATTLVVTIEKFDKCNLTESKEEGDYSPYNNSHASRQTRLRAECLSSSKGTKK